MHILQVCTVYISSVNGIPNCAHKFFMTDVLRKEWNFTGFVISDAGATEDMISGHHYFNSPLDAAAAAINVCKQTNKQTNKQTVQIL